MVNEKFKWKVVSDYEAWEQLVARSPQGTIFSSIDYLRALDCSFKLYFVLKGDDICAGVAIILSPDNKRCILDDLVIYNGVMFAEDDTQKLVSRRAEQFEVTEFVIAKLSSEFRSAELALSPHFTDLRPFQWHEYHNTDNAKKFQFELRYTSLLDIDDLRNCVSVAESSMFKMAGTLRKRQWRSSIKAGARLSTEGNVDRFLSFYKAMMLKQDIEVHSEELVKIKNLVEKLLLQARAIIFEVKSSFDLVLYSLVYAFDQKRGYYLFGAGNPIESQSWQGTFGHFSAFEYLAKSYGVSEVDLEGVNSPNRGAFKLGFGGSLSPYFQVFCRSL